MKTHNQENITKQQGRCKCEDRFRKRLGELDMKINRVELEIEKLHRINQNRINGEKGMKVYEEINLLEMELEVEKIDRWRQVDGQNTKLTNEIILSQFEYLHDEIIEMKGRVSSISGIQANLDIQVILTNQVIERQNEILKGMDMVSGELEEIGERVVMEEDRGKASQTKISWIVEYLQKCGYKYINKVKGIV